MTATVEVALGEFVPVKCGSADAAGSPANPCPEPGSRLMCQLCPLSPNYWRRTPAALSCIDDDNEFGDNHR